MKNKLKVWNKKTFGAVDRQIDEAKNKAHEFDLLAEQRGLNEVELLERRENFGLLWQTTKRKENILSQKERLNWIKEGDFNSKFFHRVINFRRRNNKIQGLQIEGKWVEDVAKVKEQVKFHIEKLFSDQQWSRPEFANFEFNQVSDGQ